MTSHGISCVCIVNRTSMKFAIMSTGLGWGWQPIMAISGHRCFSYRSLTHVPIRADTGGSTGSMRPNAISSAEPAAPAVAGQSSALPARTDGPVGALEAAAAQRKEPAAALAAAGTAQPATATATATADAPARSHTRKKEEAPRRCKRCNGYMKRHSTLSPECHAAKKAMKR